MRFGIWQVIFIGIELLGFGIAAAKHGQPKGNYSVWGTLIGIAIDITILALGGFFS